MLRPPASVPAGAQVDAPAWQELLRPTSRLGRLLLQWSLPGPVSPPLGPKEPAEQAPSPEPPRAVIRLPNRPAPPADLHAPKGQPAGEGPLVGIYHTHWWESYVSEVGRTADPPYESDDSQKSVIRVGHRLGEALLQRGIYSVQATAKPESPSGYTGAYMESLKVAQYLLQEYPTIQVLIDLHRDSAPRESMVVEINGKPVARLSLVVGMGSEHLPQPRAQQNLAFAQTIAAKMDELYPGLLFRIDPQAARFNQHLSPGAILVEFGSQENTMNEVLRSVDLFADVLAALAEEGKLPARAGQ